MLLRFQIIISSMLTLREQFEREIKNSKGGLSALFETRNQQYIEWLESKVISLEGDYPIQDDIWPSRMWNRALTDYEDLSGEQ